MIYISILCIENHKQHEKINFQYLFILSGQLSDMAILTILIN